MSIDNSLAPSEIRTLLIAHAMMFTQAGQIMGATINTKLREALLDTVTRMYSLVEAYPVEDPKAEEPTVH